MGRDLEIGRDLEGCGEMDRDEVRWGEIWRDGETWREM